MKDLQAAVDDESIATVTKHPMIPRVGPDRYEIPSLHLLLGIANDLLDNFLEWVDARNGLGLVITGDELKNAYKVEWEAVENVIDTKEVAKLFGEMKGGDYAQLRLQRSVLNEWISLTDDYSPAERREMVNDKKEIVKKINELSKEQKAIENDEKLAKVDLKTLRTARVTVEKKLKEEQTVNGWVPT